MKKIIIALALIGISYSGAEAQATNSVAKKPCKCAAPAKKQHAGGMAKSGDTYQVCREQGGYYSCCTHHKKGTAKTSANKTAATVAVK